MNVFCDFDGTITQQDTTDAVLEAFALPEYREWERMWEEGLITGRECMAQQTRLITAQPQALRSLCHRMPIDAGIYDLEAACIRNGASLFIVSDGIDLLMEEVLSTRGLSHLPHYSNRLSWDKQQGHFLLFPHADLNCRGGCGVCKCRLLEDARLRAAPRVYIGDGLSDTCVVHRADRVFAKSRLHDYCRGSGIVHEVFETLAEVALSLFGEPLFPNQSLRNGT